jgi:hypothetical protein
VIGIGISAEVGNHGRTFPEKVRGPDSPALRVNATRPPVAE